MTEKIGRLAKDVVVCGRFHIRGCHSEDRYADVAIFGSDKPDAEDMLGLMMPVSKDIERLLKNRDNLDPVDQERVREHMERCQHEGYLGMLAHDLEKSFDLDLENWKQGYAYRFDKVNNKHVRVMILVPPDADVWLLRMVIRTLRDFKKNGGFQNFDATPKHGPHAYRKRT